jgi:hypothetical protein
VSKFCSKCGNEIDGNAAFCNRCGNPVNDTVGNATIVNNIYNNTSGNRVANRNIVLAVILSFITCGLYLFYWMATITDDANIVSDERSDTSGGLVIVFSVVTCGIYTIYWFYKMGKKLNMAGVKYGKSISDNSIVYLLLGIFGFGIVNYCLIQSDLNRFS